MRLTVELGGSPRTIHLGVGAIGNGLRALGVNMADFFDELTQNPYHMVPVMMYEGYRFNKWLEDDQERPIREIEMDCTLKDFIRWISEIPDTQDGPMSRWISAYVESRTKNVPKPKGKKQPVKRTKSSQ